MPNTPYYLIHKDKLDEGMEKLHQAIGRYWSNTIVGYSFKTNSLPWILTYMKKQNIYAEVVSEDEYELAEYMGFQKIIYNGPAKGKESFLRACKDGHIINLDAWRELNWLREVASKDTVIKVGIRVNFDLEAMCPGESSGGSEGGRFGFSYEDGSFQKAYEELLQIKGVRLVGVHLHCGSKTRSLNIYRAIVKMACQIRREFNLDLEYVDVGGGYFGGLSNKPQYEDYFREMSEILKEEFSPEKVQLIVEPGTSLICPPIDYVTTVIDVKSTNRNHFVVTDGSRIHVDPLMAKTGYFYHIESSVKSKNEVLLEDQIISGFTCMENDRLFHLKNSPKLRVGDRIIYEKVGAYTMCLSPLFIEYFPAVYVEHEEELVCVREKWTAKEYVQKSLIEGKCV